MPARLAGKWYLDIGGHRATLSMSEESGDLRGALYDESGSVVPIDQIRFDAALGTMEFRSNRKGSWCWCRGTSVEGIFAGRCTVPRQSPDQPPWPTSYTVHVTGWNSDYLDRDIVPRVFEVLLNHECRGTLRIDRASPGSPQLMGRLKTSSTVSAGAKGEEPEYDLDVQQWDGTRIKFTRRLAASTQIFAGDVEGRTIAGSYLDSATGHQFPWQGERAEVLGYGLKPKSAADRNAWQQRTKRELYHLMMADNPAPLSRKVTTLRENLAPWPITKIPADRDDDPTRCKQDYRVTELQFNYALANPFGGSPLARQSHAYLAVPNSASAGQAKFPAVLAVNGHDGSAWKMMDPSDGYYWYGETFARRGYVVLAVDISHRPVPDRTKLYTDVETGDDPERGNGPHPAIAAPGFDSDWEEDGERAWDAMRALDYLVSLPQVDSRRVLVVGLSMGGEVATFVGALDPRLALTVAIGFSPDLDVMVYNHNHECFRWINADIREYVDTSDLEALIAPRALVVETGRQDHTYSQFKPWFASDKQVARRTRAAYGADVDNFLHYLHYDAHRFHAGGLLPSQSGVPPSDIQVTTSHFNPDVSLKENSVRTPVLIEPEAPGSLEWQTDGTTKVVAPTLFDWIDQHLAPQ